MLMRKVIGRAVVGLLWALFCLNLSAQTVPRIKSSPGWLRIADGVFWLPATGGEGEQANLGYLSTPAGGVLIDTGPSEVYARAAIATRPHPARPLIAAFNTHAHPENVLGNRAVKLAAPAAALFASVHTATLMRERCGECRRNFAQRYALASDTETIYPERPLAAFERVLLGGAELLTWSFAVGHVPGNSAVFEPISRTLFAGGLVTNQVVPDMTEADTEAWLAALGQFDSLNPRWVVPDRGRAGDRHLIAETARYVQGVERAVVQALQDGKDLTELPVNAGFEGFVAWTGYRERHGANLRAVYLRNERKLW